MSYKTVKNFIKDHQGEEITKHEGNFSSLVWGTACTVIYHPNQARYFTVDFVSLLLLVGQEKGIGFFNFDKYKDVSREAIGKYINDKDGFVEFDDYHQIVKEADVSYNKNRPEAIAKMNDQEVEDLIIYCFKFLQNWQVTTLFCEALDEDIIQEYFDQLQLKIDFKEFVKMSTLVDFDSLISLSDKCLLELENFDLYNAQWIFANYLCTPGINEIEKLAREKIKEAGGAEKIKGEIIKLQAEASENKKLAEEYRETLSESGKELFDFIKMTLYIRDVRKRFAYQMITVISNALRECFKRLDYNREHIIYTIYNDFIAGDYKKPEYKDELAKRENGFIIYYKDKGHEIEYVDYDQAKKELSQAAFGALDTSEIKGSVAQGGQATGKAKIVLNAKDFNKFNEGDILVTSMTRPEFVPLMKKAGAVITDEGGVTCHAAIVSRELKLPCIIGTKTATQVLKDDMQVEVDANNGLIKILK